MLMEATGDRRGGSGARLLEGIGEKMGYESRPRRPKRRSGLPEVRIGAYHAALAERGQRRLSKMNHF